MLTDGARLFNMYHSESILIKKGTDYGSFFYALFYVFFVKCGNHIFSECCVLRFFGDHDFINSLPVFINYFQFQILVFDEITDIE